jgi:nitrogen fixation/metabolism regulation signal transduction histidine kinase
VRLTSLEGKLALLLSVAAIGGVVAGVAFDALMREESFAVAAAIVVVVPLAMIVARLIVRPVSELFRTLTGAVASFRDGDFSFTIHGRRGDEVGDLVDAHNELGRVLREERQDLFQRELLLHTVVQNTPTALVLADARDRVVYANTAARQMFNGGRRVEGLAFQHIVDECPQALRAALAGGHDGIVPVTVDGQDEAYHLSCRSFQLNGQPHRLHLVRRITRELGRQEVATWKKVIRVISHELNNSLAPISSLAHSGRELSERGERANLARVFDTIEERARHLDSFIRGYATFAKLPSPRMEAVAWATFLERLNGQVAFRLAGDPPAEPASFDPAQMGQAMVNLLKNAHESGSAADAVELEVRVVGPEYRISVRDRGAGMSEAVMAHALVPFYSTKRSGTGLGLALAREIAEAHGGRLALANREGGGLSVDLWLPRGR